MAGGHMKYRHLGVKSSHRQALLRNLVTSLIEHETITTTLPKAKEAQRFAEKLITLSKRNTNAAKNRAMGILFRPDELMPKLFGPIRERYNGRPGGYTRILHVEPRKEDGAGTAILELVDGPRDMLFAMTAKALARHRAEMPDEQLNDITQANVKKVTQFRQDGMSELETMVREMELRRKQIGEADAETRSAWETRRQQGDQKERVYPVHTSQHARQDGKQQRR